MSGPSTMRPVWRLDLFMLALFSHFHMVFYIVYSSGRAGNRDGRGYFTFLKFGLNIFYVFVVHLSWWPSCQLCPFYVSAWCCNWSNQELEQDDSQGFHHPVGSPVTNYPSGRFEILWITWELLVLILSQISWEPSQSKSMKHSWQVTGHSSVVPLNTVHYKVLVNPLFSGIWALRPALIFLGLGWFQFFTRRHPILLQLHLLEKIKEGTVLWSIYIQTQIHLMELPSNSYIYWLSQNLANIMDVCHHWLLQLKSNAPVMETLSGPQFLCGSPNRYSEQTTSLA